MVVGEGLIKSKERVQKHGEVFTPPWMVEKMLAEPGIQVKLQDLHATFLEPSAGEGAFLTEILRQKLLWVNQMTPPVVHELEQLTRWKRNTLWALMSIYGIEYLADNLAKARENMLAVFCENYQQQRKRKLGRESELYRSARLVVELNVVGGNTLSHEGLHGRPIIFNEWRCAAEDGSQVARVPFFYSSLFTGIATSPAEELSLFSIVQTFNMFEQPAESPLPVYKVVDVLRVYKQEMKQEADKDGR